MESHTEFQHAQSKIALNTEHKKGIKKQKTPYQLPRSPIKLNQNDDQQARSSTCMLPRSFEQYDDNIDSLSSRSEKEVYTTSFSPDALKKKYPRFCADLFALPSTVLRPRHVSWLLKTVEEIYDAYFEV